MAIPIINIVKFLTNVYVIAAGGGHVQDKARLAAARRMNSPRGNKIYCAFFLAYYFSFENFATSDAAVQSYTIALLLMRANIDGCITYMCWTLLVESSH